MDAVHPSAWAFVVVALGGALLSVSLRNILHAIFGLALALFGIAGLFLYLGSPFVAAMEVLIYVGGISVAMVFAVMLAYSLGKKEGGSTRRFLAVVPVGGFFGVVGYALLRASFAVTSKTGSWDLKLVGRKLLLDYNVVFEALSVVLLLAIVGAIIIARRDEKTGDDKTADEKAASKGNDAASAEERAS
ncbi:MAG: NADH-quinone oxidoreductase subunit J [Myxococcales bacterium]|nr:NADH-quinone oxidoreductase subunit J [Myxococcales bacterium]